MLAELRKSGGSFGLATQSLAYLDKMDKTLRATVMANIDHLFAFAMAAEDARLLRELEGVEVEDITNLDNYMCYVRASLGTRRLPVFSLHIDPPAPGDQEGAEWIIQRSQQRDTRPVAVVDEMIAASSARASYRDPSGRGRQQGSKGDKSRAWGEAFPLPGEQTQEQPPAQKETRKRHPSKAKMSSAGTNVPSAEDLAQPQEQGEDAWNRPLLYEGVEPNDWGREAQESEK
jgi:hypothetical protein